jgi:DNA helicase-2/ATP-dependent DNA helicase PcrA
MPWHDNLTGPAREIAATNSSPLRVAAGPGTGKTFALMRRVARLLEEGANPARILLVTFTRTAARDLERELDRLSTPNATAVRKGTLHAFCFSTLARSSVLDLTHRVPRILFSFEERFMLEDLADCNAGNLDARKGLLRAFEAAWAKLQNQEPGWPRDPAQQRFQGCLEEWVRFHEGMLLAELVPLTLRYLETNPNCSERRQFEHVLVDEYQDLNRAEQRLIDILSANGSLVIIGDEDQSIYELFRHAHPEGISEFHETHSDTYDIPLNECRRCPTRVIAVANHLIQYNRWRTGRQLVPMPGNPPGEIHPVQWETMEAESDGLASYIDAKVRSGDFDPGKTLVLCPGRQFGYMIRDALRARGQDAHSYFHEEALDGSPRNPDRSRAQQALTLLTLLANPDDRIALRCWLGFGNSNLRRPAYKRLRDHCATTGLTPRQALDALLRREISIAYTSQLVECYRLLVQRLNDLRAMPVESAIGELFPQGQGWAEPLQRMIQETVDEWTYDKVLESLRISITQPERPSETAHIRVMSLHRSKGLNADHVIVVGFVEGLIPRRDRYDTFAVETRAIEEQRRLFYVAITRAKKTLVVSSVQELPRDLAHKMGVRVLGGDRETARTIASTFLSELGPEWPHAISGEDWVY